MVNFRIHWWEKGMRTKHVALLWLGALTGAAQAETGAAANLAPARQPARASGSAWRRPRQPRDADVVGKRIEQLEGRG